MPCFYWMVDVGRGRPDRRRWIISEWHATKYIGWAALALDQHLAQRGLDCTAGVAGLQAPLEPLSRLDEVLGAVHAVQTVDRQVLHL